MVSETNIHVKRYHRAHLGLVEEPGLGDKVRVRALATPALGPSSSERPQEGANARLSCIWYPLRVQRTLIRDPEIMRVS